VLFPNLEVIICTVAEGGPITAEHARDMLGWEELAAKDDSALFQDLNGKWVRCIRNTHNRIIDMGRVRVMMQDKLNKQWADSRNWPGATINGETIVIDRYGDVVNGQKRLISLCLAEQARSDTQKIKWQDKWSEPVSIEAIIVRGVDNSTRCISTIDQTQERSDADSFYADGKLYAGEKPHVRQKLCRMTEWAIKMLWDRTGAKKNPFAKLRSHQETQGFLDRHPRVEEAVAHVYKCDKDGGVSKYLTPGYAAALLYLMGCCDTEEGEYDTDAQGNPPSEQQLNWDSWDKALGFWTELSKGKGMTSHTLRAIREARRPGTPEGDPENPQTMLAYYFIAGEGRGSLNERLALLAKAWNGFTSRSGRSLVYPDPILTYRTDPDTGAQYLDDPVTVGGIDLTPERKKAKEPPPAEATNGNGDAPAEEEKQYDADGNAAEGPDDAELAERLKAARDAKKKADKEKIMEQVKNRPQTRKEVQAENTRKAREADALREREREQANGPARRMPGEVQSPEPIKYDKDGKPPPLKLKPARRPNGKKADPQAAAERSRG
jgi:hypothetical protein